MAQRYLILFKGEILAGFDPVRARADTARLLNAGPQQLAQLFSGNPVGIRKNLLAADAARYRSALSRIGLRIYVNALSAAQVETASAAAKDERASYRITYSGEVLPGLVRATVMQGVAQRLALDEVRLNRLFSGKPVILKKGLSASAATSYLTEAAQLGMRASMEIEATAQQITSVAAARAPNGTARDFMESAVKTQLYAPRAPLHDKSMSLAPQDEVRTVVDIDLMRSVAEEPVETTMSNVLDEPMPQVKIWRPQMASALVAGEPSTPAFERQGDGSRLSQPELALRSIALHSAMEAPPATRRHPALHRLAAMGALLPKALSRILQ